MFKCRRRRRGAAATLRYVTEDRKCWPIS